MHRYQLVEAIRGPCHIIEDYNKEYCYLYMGILLFAGRYKSLKLNLRQVGIFSMHSKRIDF